MKALEVNELEKITGGGPVCTFISVGATILSIFGLYPIAAIGYTAAGMCYVAGGSSSSSSGGYSGGCDTCPQVQ